MTAIKGYEEEKICDKCKFVKLFDIISRLILTCNNPKSHHYCHVFNIEHGACEKYEGV